MRRILAWGCCALTLAFGFVVANAHVHDSGGHHAESRGLHLDHGHLGRSNHHDAHGDHGHGHDHGHDHGHGHANTAQGMAGGHHHDGLYLNAAVARAAGSGIRNVMAVAVAGPVVQAPAVSSDRTPVETADPADPPDKIPPRLRAPPV